MSKRRPILTMTAQDLHIQLLNMQYHLRSDTPIADETGIAQLKNLSEETVTGKPICVLVVLTRVLTWLQWTNAHLWWPLAHWRSVLFMDESCIAWASGLLMSTLWTECPMVAVGLWYGEINYGQRTQLHFIDGNLNWMHRETVTRSWGPLFHSSAANNSYFRMIMHGPMLQGSVHNSQKLKISTFFHVLHTHKHVWHALDQRAGQHVPVPDKIQQL